MASTPRTVGDFEAATIKPTNKWLRTPNYMPPVDDGGKHRYIVQFEDRPLPLYRGRIKGLAAVNTGNGKRLNPNSAAAQAYISHLKARQNEMLAAMSAKVGGIEVLRTHQAALNAATVRMTAKMAQKVSGMPGVRMVERDRAMELTTADSVDFIGAPEVWDGTATGSEFQGEGIIVGIIDSGINHEHPSFAATGDDGHAHTNPLGAGVFLGDCAPGEGFEDRCNDKLIGSYTFLDSQTSSPPDEILIPGDIPSADTDGHGSHVASTAAGNVVFDVPLLDADGNPTGLEFSQIQGVAPHANIIAYKVCAPSCFFADIVAAVDQAILDGADVLNHSIGSSPGNPWDSSQAQAFLSARAAGIFVANSAGNSGPGAGTAEAAGNAPWVAAVAATTHDRSYPEKFLQNMVGGDTAAPADITGRSVSGAIDGDIVYAGDFPTNNGSANDTEPEQCLEPFPPGTFTANQIVLCDRGTIARVAKGQNVRDGGAGGLILGNVDGGATSVANDAHVIPAIHIDAADGNIMRAWLASGSGHMGDITAVDSTISDPAAGDNLADFSSRGPYTGFNILAPNTAAPGSAILAAGAELTQDQIDLIGELYAGTSSETPSVPSTFGEISGTSMSSPHIAGTAALLKGANPGWSDAEVLSAIMTTGTYDLVKEDGVTAADVFDFGGGRVQVNLAAKAGLIMDESSTNFENANPDVGGDPATLNVAALVQMSCVQSCSWTRTVTATVDGSWTASGFDAWVSVSPANFALTAGQSQEIEITVDASTLSGSDWSFSRAVLTPSDSNVPTTQMPLAVVSVSGDLPASIDLEASRNAGSQLYTDVTALELTDFNVKIFRAVEVEGVGYALPQDSDNSTPFDDLTDGVQVVYVDAPAGSQRANFEVLTSESPDLDLFVGLVADPGNPSVDEGLLVCVSATGTALERCDFSADDLDALRDFMGTDDLSFYALVQNWAASSEGAVDAFEFATTVVGGNEASGLWAEGPVGSLPTLTPFDVRFYWGIRSQSGKRYLSATEWYADASRTQLLGKVPLELNRGDDDVTFDTAPSDEIAMGDTLSATSTVAPNFTNEDRSYVVTARVPPALEVDPDSITEGGVLEPAASSSGVATITWEITQESLLGQEGSYTVSTNGDNAFCDTGFGGYVNLADFGIGPDPTLVGDTIAGTAFTTQNPIEFYGSPRSNGITVTDDGFAFFDSTPGAQPWVNQVLPDPADPNDLMAPMWFDWVIDPAFGGGISLATNGPDMSFIEWDDVEEFPGGGGTGATGDFEIVVFSTVDPDFPEIVFAYDNIDEAVLAGQPVTVGVENGAGTSASTYNGPIFSGLIVCFDYEGVNAEPRELSFEATVVGGNDAIELIHGNSVDNPGSRTLTRLKSIELVDPPAAATNGKVGKAAPARQRARINRNKGGNN
jgi:subtilisin family serine protease